MIQMPMSNLLSGVVTRGLPASDATNVRVGSCGAKLLSGLLLAPVAGRSVASLLVHPQCTKSPRPGPARLVLPREVRQQAVGALRRN